MNAPMVRVVREGEGHAPRVVLESVEGEASILVGIEPARARQIAADLVRRADELERGCR